MTLKQALLYCNHLTKAHSSTFYLGSRLFPARQRQAVRVVYAMCRSGDDAVDEAPNMQEAIEGLERWWQAVTCAYEGAPNPEDPLQVGLGWVLEHYAVPKAAFEELYLGLQTDLSPPVFDTVETLMLYCRRVAGVVGFMVAPIAGYRGGQETLNQALALGQAMQLTNILRDVGEDFQRGRCYLPQELLEAYEVDLRILQSGQVSENYMALLEALFTSTHTLYAQGWQGIPKLKGSASLAVAVAALNYERILHKIRENHYDNLTRRAYLRTPERLMLVPKAVCGVFR